MKISFLLIMFLVLMIAPASAAATPGTSVCSNLFTWNDVDLTQFTATYISGTYKNDGNAGVANGEIYLNGSASGYNINKIIYRTDTVTAGTAYRLQMNISDCDATDAGYDVEPRLQLSYSYDSTDGVDGTWHIVFMNGDHYRSPFNPILPDDTYEFFFIPQSSGNIMWRVWGERGEYWWNGNLYEVSFHMEFDNITLDEMCNDGIAPIDSIPSVTGNTTSWNMTGDPTTEWNVYTGIVSYDIDGALNVTDSGTGMYDGATVVSKTGFDAAGQYLIQGRVKVDNAGAQAWWGIIHENYMIDDYYYDSIKANSSLGWYASEGNVWIRPHYRANVKGGGGYWSNPLQDGAESHAIDLTTWKDFRMWIDFDRRDYIVELGGVTQEGYLPAKIIEEFEGYKWYFGLTNSRYNTAYSQFLIDFNVTKVVTIGETMTIDNVTVNWFTGEITMDVNVTHVNGDNCTFGSDSGAIVNNVAHINIPNSEFTQSNTVICTTTNGTNDTSYVSFLFEQTSTQQHSTPSNLTHQYVSRNVTHTTYANDTNYNITDTLSEGTLVGDTYRAGTNNATETFIWYHDWLTGEEEFLHSKHQNTTITSDLNTQYAYNQTQFNVTKSNYLISLALNNIDISANCTETTSMNFQGFSEEVNVGDCNHEGYSGDWLQDIETSKSTNQDITTQSTLTTQYIYNQTELNVTDMHNEFSWVDIDITPFCEQNTTALTIPQGTKVTNDNCSWLYDSGDWITETESSEVAYQNVSVTSNLTTQYYYNETNASITDTFPLNWTNIDISAYCNQNSTVSISASSTTDVEPCDRYSYSGDWLDETIGDFEQDVESITYVNGLAYILKTTEIIEILGMNWTDINISSINTRLTWTCDDEEINVTESSTYNTPWHCFNSNVIINQTAEEAAMDLTSQSYIYPTDTDLYITADVLVNNTDDAVNFTDVEYLDLGVTFNITAGEVKSIGEENDTVPITITKTEIPPTSGCGGWLRNIVEYTIEDNYDRTINGLKFAFDKGTSWTGYQLWVCNRTDDNCDFVNSCSANEWEDLSFTVTDDYILHDAEESYETLSELKYAVVYNEEVGAGGPVSDYTEVNTLVIDPINITGIETPDRLVTDYVTILNNGSERYSIKLSPSTSMITTYPIVFSLAAGESRQIEIRSRMPIVGAFYGNVSVYQNGARVTEITITYLTESEDEIERTMMWFTGFLTADDMGLGLSHGVILITLALTAGVYEFKRKKRKMSYALIGIAIMVAFFMFGKVI